MICKRAARTLVEAKRILAALRILKVDDEDVHIYAWGDWVARDGSTWQFRFSNAIDRPAVERIARNWCALNIRMHGLVDAQPENNMSSNGLIQIEWDEGEDELE